MKKRSVLCIICAFLLLLSIASTTFAWLGMDQNTIVTGITGSLVTEYFHCGSGAEDDPFVITRPIHYYHMVEFFQRLTNLPVVYDNNNVVVKFGNEYLYFQIGCSEDRLYDPTLSASEDEGETCYVFEYSSDGELQSTNGKGNKSQNLNMAYYSGELALMPVGTSEIPFYGSLDGKGITVSNLNIVATSTVTVNGTETERSTSDIGIFGYVYDSSAIQNVYFSDVVINIDGASSGTTAVTVSTSHDDSHDGTIYVGYLCGHIHNYYDDSSDSPNTQDTGTAVPFSNVYLNNCTIVGGEVSGASIEDNYGYYGCVDNQDGSLADTITALEEKKGTGDDYSFILNAQDVYSFLGTLDTSETLITRNWNESGKGSTLSSAISSSSSYYQLVGHSPDTSSVSYDYSFDTIGYSNGTNYYDLYYKNKSYISLPSATVLTTVAPSSTLTTTGSFIYDAGSNYKYYEVTQGYGENYVGTDYVVYYYDGTNYSTLSLKSTTERTTTKPEEQTEIGSYFYYENGQWYYYNVTTAYSDGTSTAYYPLYYYDGSTYNKISSGTTLDTPPATCTTVGATYLYYANGKWNYSICTSAYTLAPTFTVTFSSGTQTFTCQATTTSRDNLSSTTLNQTSVTGTVYVDGQVAKDDIAVSLSVEGSRASSGRSYTLTGTITATIPSFTISGLTEGTHTYAVVVDVSGITCSFTNRRSSSLGTATTSGDIYCGELSGTTLMQKTTDELSSDNKSVSCSYAYTNSSLTYNDSTKGNFATTTDAVFTTYEVYANTGVYYCSAGDSNVVGSYELFTNLDMPTVSNDFYCKTGTIPSEQTDSVFVKYPLSYGDSHTLITQESVFENTSPNDMLLYSSGWKYRTFQKELTDAVISGPYDVYYNDGTDYILLTSAPVSYGGTYRYSSSGDVYIADAFSSYTSYTDDDGNVWRYSADNIDIVGGLQFYSTYIYMNGYAKGTKTLTSSSLGTKFYGHSQCPDSILLYIKNVKGLADDASMGTITAYYDRYDGNNDPEDSMRLNRYAMSSDSDTNASRGFSTSLGCTTVTKTINGTSRTGYSASLTRSMIEQVAYCGIDSDGYIICYPSTSNLTMIYADGKTEEDVAYYVLFLGVSSGHLKVYEIDFEFKADHGVGTVSVLDTLVSDEPVFRYVDYRDSDDSVTNSLINMAWTMPDGASDSNFSVNVEYSATNVSIGSLSYTCYIITIVNDTGEGMSLDVILYDNDSDSDNVYPYVYEIIYNGSIVQNKDYTTDSNAYNYWQQSHTHTLE